MDKERRELCKHCLDRGDENCLLTMVGRDVRRLGNGDEGTRIGELPSEHQIRLSSDVLFEFFDPTGHKAPEFWYYSEHSGEDLGGQFFAMRLVSADCVQRHFFAHLER